MHDDPTRMMSEAATPPQGYASGGGGLDSGYKFLIAALVAIILGLVAGVVLVSGSNDSDSKGQRRAPVTRTETKTETDTKTETQTATETQTVDQTVTETQTVTTTVPAPPAP